MTEGPVIIVGGGLNGLTTAVLLADLDVPTVLVERHTGTSIQYKFAGISPRSMEIFRGAGLEDEIRAHATGHQQGGTIAREHRDRRILVPSSSSPHCTLAARGFTTTHVSVEIAHIHALPAPDLGAHNRAALLIG